MSTTAQMSSRSAVRSIMSTYLHIQNTSTPSLVKFRSHAHVKPKFDETITEKNLLEELRQKAKVKENKQLRKRASKRFQRSLKK